MKNGCLVKTNVGTFGVIEEDGEIIALRLDGTLPSDCIQHQTDLLLEAKKQLFEYVDKKRKSFDLPLKMVGTEFQKKVWQALITIPYGETMSYQTLAERVGSPKACRAVGAANGKNPIAIFVPCHRVIGKNGTMTGFGGGIPLKIALLQLEADK